MKRVYLKRTKRLLSGHLWVFSNELAESPKLHEPGSLVEVYDRKEVFLGIGYVNPHSLIAVRLLTRERAEIDGDFIRDRISRAISFRERLIGERDSLRLVFSEADGLPGLVVDKYGDCISLQILTYGMENLRDLVLDSLDHLLSPQTIVLRNDSPVRLLEGLKLYKEVVKGRLEGLPVIEEAGLFFEVDPLHGQKTGYFLDQRDNRIQFSRYVRGGIGLDLFCYSGSWSIRAAYSGAEVIGVDASERAIESAKRNSARNGLEAKTEFVREDVFAFIENDDLRVREFDFVVLDPPALVKSAGKVREAFRAYRRLNERCIRLLKPGGLLVSSSCSYHFGRELFLEMLAEAGREAGRNLRMLGIYQQAPDHPVLLSVPETNYLKCAFLSAE